MSQYTSLDHASANAIRALTLDAVQTANSGHPGMPLGMADVTYVLYKHFLRTNPNALDWFDRDRLVVSAGHGSMLPYALLYLTGAPGMPIEQLKRFRQLDSLTPGHPENHITPGVEVTTGPLGSGTANSVGMAIAEAWLAARFNRDGAKLVDHYTYAIVSDGDLQEGVSHEAASLAGHLGLGKLIWLYDDNAITIDGPTALSFSENIPQRFAAYGWQTITVDAHDMDAVEQALREARADETRPTIISCKSIIGKGLPKQGTSKAHSDAPGWDDVKAAKRSYGFDEEAVFAVPDAALAQWRSIGAAGATAHAGWTTRLLSAPADLRAELDAYLSGALPENLDQILPKFDPADKPIATRAASGKVLDALAPAISHLLGGSADLTPSNNTLPKDAASLKAGDFTGRYVRYGIREHAMAGIMNGMALHGGVTPYGGTFFCFSDFMRPAIRLAALSQAHTLFVFTHDSIGLGEDGPTHQPIEQLASLRAMPGLVTIRPADANETAAAWSVALREHGPVALVLSRQALPILPSAQGDDLSRGAYAVQDAADPQIVLLASGSEVGLCLNAARLLTLQGVRVRVVSMPSWELFDRQSTEYRDALLPKSVPALVVEAGVSQGWHKYVGPRADFLTIDDRFGASAPLTDVMRSFGFTPDNVVIRALALIAKPGI
jgi:transketolase